MKRIIAKLFVFLLLGAVVNVAVAWGCATWGRHPDDLPQWRFIRSHWVKSIPPDWSPRPDFASKVVTFGQTFVSCEGRTRRPDDTSWEIQEVREFGFPMRAMLLMRNWIASDWLYLPAGWEDEWIVPELIPWQESPISALQERYVPRHPIWPGFAINTLFYAATLWLLFAFPFTLRRWRRIRRRLCAKCAYPLGTSTVCTECGAAVRCRSEQKMKAAC